MSFRLKDQLGKCHWNWHSDDTPNMGCCGVDDCWRDENATLEELVKALPPTDRDKRGEFRLRKWQKVGRKIEDPVVKVLRFEPAMSQG